MSTPTTPTTTIATTTTTATPPDLDVKELKPLLDVIIRTIEDEQRYIIRDVCDYVPNLTIKTTKRSICHIFIFVHF